MAKKYYEKDDYTLNTDWGGDETTGGLPLPGSAVQKVIKDKFSELDESKVGYIAEGMDGKVYFSSSKEAYENGESIGSVYSTAQYTMTLEVDKDNKYVFLSSDEKKTFVWYFVTTEIASKKPYYESVTVEYSIKNTTNGTEKMYSTVIDPDYNSELTKVELDLDNYLTDGNSRLTIVIKGINTKQERTLGFEFSIISLSIEDKTSFATPIAGDFFDIIADINCTNGRDYFYEYRFDEMGEFIFDNSGKVGSGLEKDAKYTVDISKLSLGKHVLEYRLYMIIGSSEEKHYTKTQRIEFIRGEGNDFNEPQVLIFSTYSNDEEPKAEDGNLIIHGISQYITSNIRYAVYNPFITKTNVEFSEVINGEKTLNATDSISNGEVKMYELQAMENGSKTMNIICNDEDGNTNGDGRYFYVNVAESVLKIKEYTTDLRIDFSSIGKNNTSDDKATWESHTANGRFNNSAKFINFDWSQGWTDNGLVIPEGSEVVFDYAPFPQQVENPSVEEENEYVGGKNNKGYSFEIEFMTQNVTDESAILCDMTDETDGGKCGLLITGSEFKFTTPGGNVVSSRFKANEMNRFAIVIRPQSSLDKNGQIVFKGLVELYNNGILSSIAKYTDGEKFEVYGLENGKLVSKKLALKGSQGADIVVKYIRAYNSVMKPDNVVDNYILYRGSSREMIDLYDKNNVMNEDGVITPDSIMKLGNIPILIFVGRTNESELATGDGNTGDGKGNCDEPYIPGEINAKDTYYYETLERTSDKKLPVEMDVIYYNPLDKSKNFKFVKAYITPQGTSSMYYPKKNYRIYTQKIEDTRMFLSDTNAGFLELDQMLVPNFGEREEDRKYEVHRGKRNKKMRLYSFKNGSQPVKCWCLKADFAETSSSHNTGIARLWGDTMKKSTVTIKDTNREIPVFKTKAQEMAEIIDFKYDVRTTIDGFPIVVFGKKSYADEYVFLGKYNFNNDKSTESVFGFCDIDNKEKFIDDYYDEINDVTKSMEHTLDEQLDQYMTCVETLDNGHILANFAAVETLDTSGNTVSWDDSWDQAFEFRYPEIPEKPNVEEYQDNKGNWIDQEGYNEDLAKWEEEFPKWETRHLKPFKHFATWVYSTRWCDVYGNPLPGLSEAEIKTRKERFANEKWDHLDVWKVAAYYVYVMRFGAVDQVVKNSMLTSEGPFAYNANGQKYGKWDATGANGLDWKENTDFDSPEYGKYYKWYYINYDNDTIMGVKNDGRLVHSPEIMRTSNEAGKEGVMAYAGWDSTLWNNIEYDEEFQNIIRIADQGISRTLTYSNAIRMFDIEQVSKWCERIYNKDAEYKYINPYVGNWDYYDMVGKKDENVEDFSEKLFMLQGSRTAHRRWWLSRRFNLFDGKWLSGDYGARFIEIKCDFGAIGNTFGAVAGSTGFFGYQINNKTFAGKEGGVNTEYKAGEVINWELQKNIQIGDPVAVYGSTDILELNLQGISKNLSTIAYNFGKNEDLGNKLERLIISIPDEEFKKEYYYKTYADDPSDTVNRQTGFQKLQKEHPELTEAYFESEGLTREESIEQPDASSPDFYRIPFKDEEGEIITYVYFEKIKGNVRNYSCTELTLAPLDKLQVLKMAGYMGISTIGLGGNKFITDVDARYSSVSDIAFAEGARIRNLAISPAYSRMALTRCDNLTLSNIMVDNQTLSDEGGKNIIEINIDNSVGLNHSNDFKTFILRWMKGGYGFKETHNKNLVLKGVKWAEMTMEDIDTIMEFNNKAKQCYITGVIEMANVQLMKEDVKLIEDLERALGGGVIIRMPYANVILNAEDSEIIAGQSIRYECTLFPTKDTILDGGGLIEGIFVKEVQENGEGVYADMRNNRYYKEVLPSEVRNGLRIRYDRTTNEIVVDSNEVNVGKDVNTIVMAKLSYEGSTKFDITPLLIKEPTYATSGIINGTASLNERNNTFEFNVSLFTDKNVEPIGTVDIEWSISGEGTKYIASSGTSNNNRVLKLTTVKDDQPDLTDEINITAIVKNHNYIIYPDLTLEKKILVLNERIILTEVSNPTVMRICKAKGWAVESDIAMTKEEGEKVSDIGTAFANVKVDGGWSFDEFKYFTNVELTALTASAFSKSNITSIVLPENISVIGDWAFSECNNLKDIELNENISEIPVGCFFNCSNLSKLNLPDSVTKINKYSLGGVGFEKILEKTNLYNTEKALYVSSNSLLHTISNDAFETSQWSPTQINNVLKEVVLPKKLGLDSSRYNFLLSEYLEKISFINEEESRPVLRNNILFAAGNEQVVVRVLPKVKNSEVINEITLNNTQEVYDYAFFKAESINKVKFTNTLYQYGLGIGVFYGSSIRSVDLSESLLLRTVRSYTFYNCENLEEVKFPMNGSLYVLGSRLFHNSPNLEEIILPDTVMECEASNDSNKGSYMISNCGIKSFKYPENLTHSQMYLVQYCDKLETLELSKYFALVENEVNVVYTFVAYLNKLKTVKLPIFSKKMEETKHYVFRAGKVKSGPYLTVDEANSVKQNYETIEAEINRDNPKTYEVVTFNEGDVLIVNSSIFRTGEYESFENCPNIDKFVMHDEDTNDIIISDNGNALYSVGKIENINGINIVKPYGYNVLERVCPSISTYNVLPNTKIITNAFSRCEKLESFVVPSFVEYLKGDTFYGCINLKDIVLHENINYEVGKMFYRCTSLKEMIIPKNMKQIGQYAFYGCTSLEKVVFLPHDLDFINWFAFCSCNKIKEMIFLNSIAPTLKTGPVYETGIFERPPIDVYQYHPFGYDKSTYVGYGVNDNKVLYLPYGAEGYDTEVWLNPLQNPSGSNFTSAYTPLNTTISLTGNALSNYEIIYMKSESGNFVNNGEVESAIKGDNGFIILLNNKVYDNETVNVYSDKECTNFIGSFTPRYGADEYIIGNVSLSNTRKSSMFSTDLFGTTSNEVKEPEMANITKLEYEILLSKVNQLMKLIDKKK